MPRIKADEKQKVRTTLSIPKPVYEEARSFVEKREAPADSINALFVTAITTYVKLLRRKEVDAQFAAMAKDADYQKRAKLISDEFSQSDWEAFERAEREA